MYINFDRKDEWQQVITIPSHTHPYLLSAGTIWLIIASDTRIHSMWNSMNCVIYWRIVLLFSDCKIETWTIWFLFKRTGVRWLKPLICLCMDRKWFWQSFSKPLCNSNYLPISFNEYLWTICNFILDTFLTIDDVSHSVFAELFILSFDFIRFK